MFFERELRKVKGSKETSIEPSLGVSYGSFIMEVML